QAELEVGGAVEPGADVLQIRLEIPERERHTAIVWHLRPGSSEPIEAAARRCRATPGHESCGWLRLALQLSCDPMLRVSVLGQLGAEVDGTAINPSESRKAWALLGWMALHPGPNPRSVVAATLWPDVLDASALQSLRSALWSLRRALGSGAQAVTG